MALIGSLNSGISALRNFARGLEVIGNNIANVNSVAFKGSTTKYTDSFSQFLSKPASSPTDGNGSNSSAAQIGMGVEISGIQSKFLQGALSTTGQTTDLAIEGEGFFQVRNVPDNTVYATRAGDFRKDDRNYLVTNDGYRVQGLTGGSASWVATATVSATGERSLTWEKTDLPPAAVGDIQISYTPTFADGLLTNSTGGLYTDAELEELAPELDSFTIATNGELTATLTNTGDSIVLGRVLLMNFQDPTALTREGSNLFSGFEAAGVVGSGSLSVSANAPESNGLGAIRSGTLELSNVDLTEEFANLITTQRSFQAGSRIITVSDDVLEEVVNLKR
jgi:flagellar hook protein FlgE